MYLLQKNLEIQKKQVVRVMYNLREGRNSYLDVATFLQKVHKDHETSRQLILQQEFLRWIHSVVITFINGQ